MTQKIVISGGDHEHVLGFEVAPGAEPGIRYQRVALGELSRLVLSGEAFDVAEYSLANHIMLRDAGDDRLSAIPVFPSRAFRNISVFVPKDSALREIRQLAGCKMGVSDFAMTTAVWTRGHLRDANGLDPRSIEWVTGANPRFPPPAGLRAGQSGEDLEGMLLLGKIDALMAGRPRDLKLPLGERRLRCVVDDAQEIEQRYLAQTGLFPIMHTVVLHSRVMQDQDIAKRVFDGYVLTKRTALNRRLGAGFMPFAERLWDRYGPPGAIDPYQHGLTPLNRRNIATLSRYLQEQGLIKRAPLVDELFVPGSADWLDA